MRAASQKYSVEIENLGISSFRHLGFLPICLTVSDAATILPLIVLAAGLPAVFPRLYASWDPVPEDLPPSTPEYGARACPSAARALRSFLRSPAVVWQQFCDSSPPSPCSVICFVDARETGHDTPRAGIRVAQASSRAFLTSFVCPPLRRPGRRGRAQVPRPARPRGSPRHCVCEGRQGAPL